MTISTPLISATNPFERPAETTSNVPYPASGITNHHYALLFGSVNNIGLMTDPGGWTKLKSASATGNTALPDFAVYGKVMAGTENGGSQAVVHNNNISIWQILCFDGVDLTTPIDVASDFKDLAATGAAAHSSMTLTKAGCTLVEFAALSGSTSTSTPLTGWTETLDRSTGTRNATIAYKQGLAAGATGALTPVTFSGSGNLLGLLVALRPAAAARPGFIKKAGIWVPLDEVLT